jgi:hemoglobin
MKPFARISLVALAAAAALAPSLAQSPAAAPPPASLYDRLGGLYPIAAVVDDFIDRVYENDTLNANPNIARARSEVRKPGLKVQVANQVCMVTGGPCTYTGKSMKESHAGFRITQKEWDALMVDFRASLDSFKVPSREQQELIAIVESTRPDIVEGAAPSK